MEIKSKPANRKYREHFDHAFGRCNPSGCAVCRADRVLQEQRSLAVTHKEPCNCDCHFESFCEEPQHHSVRVRRGELHRYCDQCIKELGHNV